MRLPKLNEPLIKKVLEHIKQFPASYNQNDTATPCDVTKRTPCGAIGCFGGWAVLLQYPLSKRAEIASKEEGDYNYDILSRAKKLVGLTDSESEYLFDAASGDPKKDYKTIVQRIEEIRAARKRAAATIPLREKLEEQVEKAGGSVEWEGDIWTIETSEGVALDYSEVDFSH